MIFNMVFVDVHQRFANATDNQRYSLINKRWTTRSKNNTRIPYRCLYAIHQKNSPGFTYDEFSTTMTTKVVGFLNIEIHNHGGLHRFKCCLRLKSTNQSVHLLLTIVIIYSNP